MTSTQTVALDAVRKIRTPQSLTHCVAVLAGAFMMLWPAIYNGFPLLYPDSMTYIGDGPVLARKLFLHQSSSYYGMRSFFYSLGILPLHWNITAWPIVAFQAILMSYVLWLVVRSTIPRRAVSAYMVLLAVLSASTTLSWYASIVMPDILGPALYLTFYLLTFARETTSHAERMTLLCIACWAVTAHATHFMLGAGLCFMLMATMLLERWPARRFLSAAGEMTAILAIAAIAQLVLYGYFYGTVSLNGERPPYLMARFIADGTGRKYLAQHCGAHKWTICDRFKNLEGDADHFLWDPDGGWGGASTEEQKEMREEEMSFVLATLQTYPREQLSKSMSAFWQQLKIFGIEDLDPSSWVAEQFEEVLPRARVNYLASRQASNALHIEEFTAFQIWIVRGFLLVMLLFLSFTLHRAPSRLIRLSIVVVWVVVSNAFVTGTMSMVDERYGSRVIWLVPFLICLYVLDWFFDRRTYTKTQDLLSKNRSTSVMS
ncbi:MAG TPA: hypothetical protein VNU92_07690 [Edaphobacter sp.]|jgi:hypothetical protein|nr:hypothetical protein [Edaphobacter sp.]